MSTIAAISTGMTSAGISIVRISGPEAISIADKIYKGSMELKNAKTHTIHYGFIYDEEKAVDEVLVSVMKAPKTYTGENLVEINCHGGICVTKNILSLLLKNGARLAEPGEFTKRAFLNGKIDLSKAEAVAEMIGAKNQFAMTNSIAHLKGAIYEKIKELRDLILDKIAFVEAALDDPEHYDLDHFGEELEPVVENLTQEIDKMIKRSHYGSMFASGIKTAIVGRPNAGKSSLLNKLSGYEKAIVTDVAGTTRDIVYEQVTLEDITLLLMDTAGIRKTEDLVEKIGVDKAKEVLNTAELILYVIDKTKGITNEDLEILETCKEKPILLLLNKNDICEKEIQIPEFFGYKYIKAIKFSAETGEGLENLEKEILKVFNEEKISFEGEIVITNERQKDLLIRSNESLKLVKEGIANFASEEFLVIDLTEAYRILGEIIGEEVNDDVIDRVFEKFCMGK